jgi:hypothetical protein
VGAGVVGYRFRRKGITSGGAAGATPRRRMR